MAKWEVQIVESRDLVFEVDAASADEAFEIATELDASDATRDSFRSRERDWEQRMHDA